MPSMLRLFASEQAANGVLVVSNSVSLEDVICVYYGVFFSVGAGSRIGKGRDIPPSLAAGRVRELRRRHGGEA